MQSLDTLEYNLGISIPGQTTVKYELADIEARFSAELEVLGASPPLVTGDVTLYSGRDRSPFPTGREGSVLMMSLSGEDPLGSGYQRRHRLQLLDQERGHGRRILPAS